MVDKLELLEVEKLKPHPQNEYFFDDMSGVKWQEFKESIKTSGVIEPIVVTQDMTIVSGHQRVRACIEEGIEFIQGRVREYENEDAILKDLLETNIRQRGNIDSSALKLGRIITELERIYGVQEGRDGQRKVVQEILDINRDSYRRAKSLVDLIPELQDEVENENISASVASRILARLSPEKQKEVLDALPKDVKLSQRDVQEYVQQVVKEKDLEIENLNEDLSDMVDRIGQTIKEADKQKREASDAKKEAENARREASALNEKLKSSAQDIAAEFIAERDKAKDDARKQAEKHLLAMEKIRENEYEIKRLNILLDRAKKESASDTDDSELQKQIAELAKQKEEAEQELNDLTREREESISLNSMVDFIRLTCKVVDGYIADCASENLSLKTKSEIEKGISELDDTISKVRDFLGRVNRFKFATTA